MISVIVITYNQCGYIRECLDGILMQRTRSPFQIVIGEDGSTDGTTEVVLEYQKRHPSTIKVLTSERNMGIGKNTARTIVECTGEYIAFCEGDDYWTNANKLQIQLDFLRRNQDCNLCFHNVAVRRDGKFLNNYYGKTRASQVGWVTKPEKPYYFRRDLLENNPVVTGATFFRNPGKWFEFGEWFTQTRCVDMALWYHVAGDKKIRYLPAVMGVYRLHGNSAWSSTDSATREAEAAKMRQNMLRYLGGDDERT